QCDSAAEVDVIRVLNQRETDALGVVVRGPAQPFGRVHGAQVVVHLPPHGPVAVDSALAGQRHVVRVADVDQRRGPRHLDTGDARGVLRVVLDVLRAGERYALV